MINGSKIIEGITTVEIFIHILYKENLFLPFPNSNVVFGEKNIVNKIMIIISEPHSKEEKSY